MTRTEYIQHLRDRVAVEVYELVGDFGDRHVPSWPAVKRRERELIHQRIAVIRALRFALAFCEGVEYQRLPGD